VRKLFLLVLVVAAIFIYVCHQRLFLRDPLAKVERDGVEQRYMSVLINYTNDVLLDDRSDGRNRVYVVQNWNLVPSVPAELKCFGLLACLADDDHVKGAAIHGAKGKPAVMTNKRVEFVDEDGKKIVVTLR
jgi:hypothetical protein